eukprot:6757601-Karenia_brevis.AAC.1
MGRIKMEGWDDVNMVPLDGEAVNQARQDELAYIVDMNVFRLMPRAEAHRLSKKIISGKWIDTNKGDSSNPIYRSRYVGREYNDSKMEGLFAGTPPLEAM